MREVGNPWFRSTGGSGSMAGLGAFALVLTVMLAGCGEGASQADLDEVVAERDQLTDELDGTEAEVEELQAQVARLSSELQEEKSNTTDALEKADALDSELTGVTRKLNEAEAEIEDLRVRFDPQLREEAEAAWANEVDRACEEAGTGTSAIRTYVDWDDEWRTIGTQGELIAEVTACAQPLRERSEAEKLSDECEVVQTDQVTKSPDALAGNCYEMFVIPWQWDSRTGECSFLGAFDPSNQGTRRFRYDGDGLFTALDAVCERDLTEADQDDVLRVWADLIGSFSYDTAAGGTNEVPQFVIRRAELIRKA